MNVATVFALAFIILLGIGTMLNPDLMTTRFHVTTGLGSIQVPVILILTLFAAAAWFILLLVVSRSQGLMLRKLEQLSVSLVEKECEILRVKATSLDDSVRALQSISRRLDVRLRALETLLGVSGSGVVPPVGAERPLPADSPPSRVKPVSASTAVPPRPNIYMSTGAFPPALDPTSQATSQG